MVAEGNILRFSEPEQFRYFRSWAQIDAGEEILAVVSREEVAEVYTKSSVKYIVGAPPYFELRETGVTEGPISKESIVKTDVGTFALFADGIYLSRGGSRKNLTAGVNTPWLEAMTSPATAVGGASKGIYYLVDADGSSIAYDWEQGEWFSHPFPERPEGFLHIPDTGLVARLPGTPETHLTVGTDSTTAVTWSISFAEHGDGRLRKPPSSLFLDIDGEMTMTFYTDGEATLIENIAETNHFPLPIGRCRYWSLTLGGSGKKSDTEIRKMEWR